MDVLPTEKLSAAEYLGIERAAETKSEFVNGQFMQRPALRAITIESFVIWRVNS